MTSIRLAPVVALLSATALAAPAAAVDLFPIEIKVTQGVQYGDTPLVADNVTMVRVRVYPGSADPVPNVDGRLQVIVDGVEPDWSPVWSINGPITAKLSPNEGILDDYLNFLVVVPESGNVSFKVEVDPLDVIEETFENNNLASFSGYQFVCRATVELVFVPINYTPGGGVPTDSLIEPGVGDGFLRAIYSVGEWDYHRTPMGPLLWTQNINNSNGALLNTLLDIRANQLPAAGYPIPTFIFGWLPGNPFSGNGQANGIPGDAAFGNTQTSRHQRTFAHEVGHLWGLGHTGDQSLDHGVDVEHFLWNPLSLPVMHSPGQWDVMVAGQLTNTAYVDEGTYTEALTDPRSQCSASPFPPEVPVYRVSGLMHHDAGDVTLDPVMWIERGVADWSDPEGDITIVVLDPAGQVLHETDFRTGTTRQSCSGDGTLDPDSPIHVLVPARYDNGEVAAIAMIDRATGVELARRDRSASTPMLTLDGVSAIGGRNAGPVIDNRTPVDGEIEVTWSAIDADGDDLVYNLLYSPDLGERWVPLGVNLTNTSFTFDTGDVPASWGNGLVRVIATDGLNHAITTSPPLPIGGGSPPETHLMTPNDASGHAHGAGIVFHAASWDLEDLMLTGDSITWTSSVDGEIGSGEMLLHRALSPGTHVITVRGTDSNNDFSEDSITITVDDRLVNDPDINGDGFVGVPDLLLVLTSWGQCDLECPADLNEDEVVDLVDLLIVLTHWG